jgi:circadian clock protein KaiB
MKRAAPFCFRLYVAGDARNSAAAVANLRALCRAHIPDRHEIEVVDVFRHPQRALADGIFMTPTLVKLQPTPAQMIVGTLSETRDVLDALGLSAGPERSTTSPSARCVEAARRSPG